MISKGLAALVLAVGLAGGVASQSAAPAEAISPISPVTQAVAPMPLDDFIPVDPRPGDTCSGYYNYVSKGPEAGVSYPQWLADADELNRGRTYGIYIDQRTGYCSVQVRPSDAVDLAGNPLYPKRLFRVWAPMYRNIDYMR